MLNGDEMLPLKVGTQVSGSSINIETLTEFVFPGMLFRVREGWPLSLHHTSYGAMLNTPPGPLSPKQGSYFRRWMLLKCC